MAGPPSPATLSLCMSARPLSGTWAQSRAPNQHPHECCPTRPSPMAGKSYKIGEVHEGTATMDWMEQEQVRRRAARWECAAWHCRAAGEGEQALVQPLLHSRADGLGPTQTISIAAHRRPAGTKPLHALMPLLASLPCAPAGAWHHHHLGGHHVRVARPPHQRD